MPGSTHKILVELLDKTTRGIGTTAKGAGSRVATGVSGGLGRAAATGGFFGGVQGILSGGISKVVGNIVRAGGQAAQAGSEIAGGIASGIASGLASSIPVIGDGLSTAISGGIELVATGIGKFAGSISALAGGLADAIGSALKPFLVGALGVAIASAMRAVRLEEIEIGFGKRVELEGLKAEDALKRLQVASRGTIDNLTLMANFNLAEQLGAAKTIKDMEKLVGLARDLSPEKGISEAKGLDALVVGLARLSSKRLDDVGIQHTMAETGARLAAISKETGQAFTAEERAIEFRTDALDKGIAKQKLLGDVVVGASIKFKRFKTDILNTSDSIGKAILPAIVDLTETLRPLLEDFRDFLGDPKTIQGIADATQSMADALENLSKWFNEGDFDSLGGRLVGKLEEAFSGFFKWLEEQFDGVFKRAGDAAIEALPSGARSLLGLRTSGEKEAAAQRAQAREQRGFGIELFRAQTGFASEARGPSKLEEGIARGLAPGPQLPPGGVAGPSQELAEAAKAEAASLTAASLDILSGVNELQAATEKALAESVPALESTADSAEKTAEAAEKAADSQTEEATKLTASLDKTTSILDVQNSTLQTVVTALTGILARLTVTEKQTAKLVAVARKIAR